MRRTTRTASLLLPLSLAAHPLCAAVPIRWTVETSRAEHHAIEQFSGTSIDLEAALKSYGSPLDVEGEPRLYWQTNGMGSAWWSAPATASNNVLRATWTPACETGGATFYKGFVGIPGSIYSAAFTLRLRPSPGAAPNALPLPAPRIDFAAVEVANAPWVEAETDPTVPAWAKADSPPAPADYAAVSSRAMSAVQPDELAPYAKTDDLKSYVKSDLGVNAVQAIGGTLAPEGLQLYKGWNKLIGKDTSTGVFLPLPKYVESNPWGFARTDVLAAHAADTNNPHAVTAAQVGAYTQDETDERIGEATGGLATSDDLAGVQADVSTLNVGYARLYGFATGATNANFTATNYPPTAAEAAARCRYRPEPGMDFSTVPASLQLNENRDGSWRTVMDTRDWTVWYFRFKETQLTNDIARLKAENAALSNRLEAARAWADRTADGVENPMSDTLVVDRPNMWLMAGHEWQKCVSASNQCFVIRAKDAALSGGANTNGFLEVCDAFGKPYMRVNKSAEAFADPVLDDIRFDSGEGAWYVVFGNTAKPTRGGANCEIEGGGSGKYILYAEDDPDCPATITWPESDESHAGHWVMKAVPKAVDGAVPKRMFFGAEIKVAGRDYVEYVKEASFGAGIRVGNNVYDAVESDGTLVWRKRND